MPSGEIEFVAYGSLNIYITGNPQITFFKSVYRRHTNFAIESIEQTFIQIPQFGKKTSITLSKNGDLVHNMYALVTLPILQSPNFYIYGVGNALFKKIELSIGSFIIDTHYSDWLNIWNELTTDTGKIIGYDRMVYNYYNKPSVSSITCYVPLQFWFNRNPGLALPLVALQFHDITLNFEFETMELLSNNAATSATNLDCRIYANFIYLDIDERRLFSQHSHEYLIEQVQYNEFTISSGISFYNAKLNFKLPIKELIWIHTPSLISTYGMYDYSCANPNTLDMHTFTNGKLTMNGSDRFVERNADYFYLLQNYQHHTHVPRTQFIHKTYNDNLTELTSGYYRNYIYTYSFALEPENHQPNGCCNFSRLKNAELQLKYDITSSYYSYNYTRVLKVFAVNYNILKVSNGMAGLILSN